MDGRAFPLNRVAFKLGHGPPGYGSYTQPLSLERPPQTLGSSIYVYKLLRNVDAYFKNCRSGNSGM